MAKSDYAYAPQRIQQEQEPDFMTYTGGEEGSFGLDDLAEDHNYNVIEKQMMSRFGMSEKTYDRQEVIDKWVNYNRKFNVGNTLSVLGEASYLSKADDKEKFNALNSYKLWDNMKGLKYKYHKKSSLTPEMVNLPNVDLMLVDSVHNYNHVSQELKIHAQTVNKYIILFSLKCLL